MRTARYTGKVHWYIKNIDDDELGLATRRAGAFLGCNYVASVHSPLSTQSSFSSTLHHGQNTESILWYFRWDLLASKSTKTTGKKRKMKIKVFSPLLQMLTSFKNNYSEKNSCYLRLTRNKHDRPTWIYLIWKSWSTMGGYLNPQAQKDPLDIKAAILGCPGDKAVTFSNIHEIFQLVCLSFDWQVTKLVLTVVTVFIFCWLPHWVTQASFEITPLLCCFCF